MSDVNYNIINTGSDGNCTIIEKVIMVDCGISFKRIKPYIKDLKLVLLTHAHSDHFCSATIAKLAAEKPTIRFCVATHLVRNLVDIGVNLKNIDVVVLGQEYKYGDFCSVIAERLYHDVPNNSWKIFINGKKILYATDTSLISHIEAKGFDLFLIESNYKEDVINRNIALKQAKGEYAYEIRSKKTHLSDEKCNQFFWDNMTINSKLLKLHKSKHNW